MRRAWLALGAVGVVALVPFDQWWTLTIGVVCLLLFVAVGVATIAAPGFLEEDADS